MTSQHDAMTALLDEYVASGKEVQLKLRGDLALVQGIGGLGPGKLGRGTTAGLYSIHQQAQIATGTGAQVVTMEFWFRAEDVLWLSEGPQRQEGPRIVSPAESGIRLPSA